MRYIDLRSDTVTKPTIKMREAMFNASVGDDVYGDDPTVIELEKLAANMLGKEAALFIPSGTFGNQLAILTHTNRGDEVIVETTSHIFNYEVGAAAVIAGVQLHAINGTLGKMDLNEVKKAIREDDIHLAKTSLICLENALGLGKVLDIEYMRDIYKLAKDNHLNVHLDGARVFNAATSLGVNVKDIAKYTDSVMFCLSKGLAAPVGSMLVGSESFINKARKNRKLMGGGMRQVGVLAACGIISLETMTKRLGEDHQNAKYLAKGLEEIKGINVLRNRLNINMVFVTFDKDINIKDNLVELLLKKGIKINGFEDGEIRFVTNNDITKEDIDYTVDIIKEILSQ